MEKESNKWQPDHIVWSLLPPESLPSFHSTIQGKPNPLVDCNVGEIVVHEIDLVEPTFATNEQITHEICKDLIENDNEFLDPFAVKIEEYYNKTFNDNSNFGVVDSYQMKQKVKAKGAETVMGIGMEPQTNQISLLEKPQHISPAILLLVNHVMQSTVYLQDVLKDAKDGESYDKQKRKTTEENDDGSKNKENIENLNSHDKCENSTDIQSGTRNKRNDKDEKRHVCETCNKSFRGKYNLKIHSSIHTNKRPYVCETCNKSFRLKDFLMSHSIMHKDERPYLCGICDKSFRRRADLLYHEKHHNGEKPFVCNVCQKAFLQIGALRTHSNIHTGERTHVCKICGKLFAHKASLLNHSKLHIDKTLH